jgi:cellulose biosynthesis protein BcsQ
MSIIAMANSKGGCGKSTLAQCLAYSKAFAKKYKRIALVELDRQGTLNAWHAHRNDDDGAQVSFVLLYSTSPKQAAGMLQSIYKNTDCMIMDLPGESERGFSTSFGIGAADAVLVPLQNSTADLDAFGSNLLPVLQDLKAYSKTFILPSFVHPAANQAKMRDHFQLMMPKGIRTMRHCFPSRSIYKYYGEDGASLNEYAKASKTNKREHIQVAAAINDVEKIAREIIKHAG